MGHRSFRIIAKFAVSFPSRDLPRDVNYDITVMLAKLLYLSIGFRQSSRGYLIALRATVVKVALLSHALDPHLARSVTGGRVAAYGSQTQSRNIRGHRHSGKSSVLRRVV